MSSTSTPTNTQIKKPHSSEFYTIHTSEGNQNVNYTKHAVEQFITATAHKLEGATLPRVIVA
jgi:hypothetical protein